MPTSPNNKSAKTTPPTEEVPQDADDWSGLTDAAERRRRQNRVNQRARRKRQQLEASKNDSKSKESPRKSPAMRCPTATALIHNSTSNRLSKEESKITCMTPDSRALLVQFAQEAYRSYMLGSPTSEHLLTLTKVNVFRAYIDNMKLIGSFSENTCDDSISRFYQADSSKELPLEESFTNMPLNLRPTKIQRTIPHHPWLDFFPHPRMRDNLIQAESTWDDEELCVDLMAFWGGKPQADAGLLVWGEPWDIRNWEMTEPFIKKYQWAVRGCVEMMTATNAWRAKRGEKLIFRYMY